MEWRAHIARFGPVRWPGPRWCRWVFAALFLVAALLRFLNFSQIAYTHDELSALVRIYPTLSETIQRGVIELDTHPPGVQVFEWAWTKTFGTSERVVKFPFALLALFALFLLYRFAISWTSEATALVVVALLATMQYTVMYAQIARPYAIGLFTTALLADQFTRYLAFGRRSQLVWMGVAVVLSAYTHHFALLIAALMTLTGLSLVPRMQRKPYLFMMGASVLAYLPNLPIFLKQLSLGGLAEWLAPPDRYWITDHLWWLAHHSLPFALLLVGIVILALVLRFIHGAPRGPARWFLPLWGLAPLIIGLAYSVWRAPVVQYSMLLFSFPYVLIALFAGLRGLGRNSTVALCAAIIVFATHSLIYDRHHYSLIRQSRYATIVQKAAEVIAQYGKDRVLVLIDAPEPQIRFYLDRQDPAMAELEYIQLRSRPSNAYMDSVLKAATGKVVVLGISNGAMDERAAQVQSYFPIIHERQDVVEGQVFVFGEEAAQTTILDRALIASATPTGSSSDGWEIHPDLPVLRDSTGAPLAWDVTDRVYAAAWTADLDDLLVEPEDLIEVVLDFKAGPSGGNTAVVLEFLDGEERILYRVGDSPGTPGSSHVVTVAAPSDHMGSTKGIRMKTYVYHTDGSEVHITGMRIYRREANPIRYGLIAPIKRMPRHP